MPGQVIELSFQMALLHVEIAGLPQQLCKYIHSSAFVWRLRMIALMLLASFCGGNVVAGLRMIVFMT